MCAILCILDIEQPNAALRGLAIRLARRMRHRGPDWSGVYVDDTAVVVHERLAIVDIEHGAQPLISEDGQQVLAVNGEIYNHQALREAVGEYDYSSGSDCEVILPLYRRHGVDFLNRLNGIFAFVIHDRENGRSLIARDPIGVMPLYVGHDQQGNRYVASEMKALVDICADVKAFPPGHYQIDDEPPVAYYQPAWRDLEQADQPADPDRLRDALDAAVQRQLMCDVPYGVLLSGGLDSSIIAALAARHAARRVEEDEQSPAWWPRLHSFSVGLEGSPDLAAAEQVAAHIGSVHHPFQYTIQEGIDALEEVIHHLETYDVTTIRAATPMYLMARKIRAMGVKMVLSGEGADEIFGGYLYFHKAPDAAAFHAETLRKLDALHQYDCLRANKAMAAWGVEARVPFLDREFLDVAMAIDPKHKMVDATAPRGAIEKTVLRQAFEGYLPDALLWRQKEQFSDGVGYGWIDSLKDHAEHAVSERQFARAATRFPVNTPVSREAYLYRALFERHFPGEAAARTVPGGPSIACSTPAAIEWDAAFAAAADPSGRAVAGVHDAGLGS